ncbi:MAG TPA: protein kinase [Solimonas sp.]
MAIDAADPTASGHSLLWRFGTVELDGRTLMLSVDGAPVELEPKPRELLLFLLRHAGEIVTKDEVFEAVWPGRVVVEAALTNCVAKLRAAIGDHDQTQIQNVRGVGYKLAAPVVTEVVHHAGSAVALQPGDAIPKRPQWRLAEKIGEGGSGEVWRVEHGKTHESRVFKFALDATAVGALKREITLNRLMREALGERADLVRLIDWNLDEAPCYLEMEYVAGGNLAQWATRQGGIGTLDPATRIELVAQAAEAVAAAHSVGILHKDLKPANLLVELAGGAPRLKLCDYGAARLLEDARLAQAGITRLGFTRHADDDTSTSGTPLYQPPEVVAGQMATIQSDVYALGVLLYQVIAGNLNKPLAPGWETDIDDALLREDIAAAAAGDPARRLTDAAELARRLRSLPARRAQAQAREQAQLADAALRARVLRAEARRGLLHGLIATLLLGSLIVSWLYLDASTERQRAEREAHNAQAVTQFLSEDLLASANPFTRGRRDLTVRETLDAAARTLDARIADADVRATLQAAIGSAYAGIGEREPAEAHLHSALAYWKSAGIDAEPAAQSARRALAEMYAAIRDEAALTRISEDILQAEARTRTPNPDLAALTQLALDYDYCFKQAPSQQACIDRLRGLHERATAQLGAHNAVAARIGLALATVLSSAGQAEAALALGAQSLDDWRAAAGPDDPVLLSRSQDYGTILTRAGKSAEALALLTDLRSRISSVYGADHPEVQLIEIFMLEPLLKTGQAAAALELADRVHRTQVERAGADDRYARFIRGRRAEALFALGRKPEALDLMRALIRHDEATDGEHGLTPRHRATLQQMEAG